MSRHIVENQVGKFVFGWDPPLMAFYLQLHSPSVSRDENPIVWLTRVHTIDELFRHALSLGLAIDPAMRTELYDEKAEGI